MAQLQHPPPRASRAQECIQDCLDCYDICTVAEAHCERKGGRWAHPTHLQLLADCARLCQLVADFLLRSSPRHAPLCRIASDICALAARDCRRFGEDEQMRLCAAICEDCARSCGRLARASG